MWNSGKRYGDQGDSRSGGQYFYKRCMGDHEADQRSDSAHYKIRRKAGGADHHRDIAKSYMDAHDNYFLSNAKTQYRSIANTVEGKVVTGNPHGYFVKGKVVIGAAHPDKLGEFLEEDDLVILGDRHEGPSLCCRTECQLHDRLQTTQKSLRISRRLRKKNQCVIIESALDTFSVARLINQSIPVKHIMKKDNLITFQTDDYTDNIKDIMVKNATEPSL